MGGLNPTVSNFVNGKMSFFSDLLKRVAKSAKYRVSYASRQYKGQVVTPTGSGATDHDNVHQAIAEVTQTMDAVVSDWLTNKKDKQLTLTLKVGYEELEIVMPPPKDHIDVEEDPEPAQA
jgi:hypothetical protein